MRNKTKSSYEIFSKLRAQYKSKSKSVYSEFIRRSENEIKINQKKFWK